MIIKLFINCERDAVSRRIGEKGTPEIKNSPFHQQGFLKRNSKKEVRA
jgi:hypothetical protein